MSAENFSVLSSRVETASYWEAEIEVAERRSSKRRAPKHTARWKSVLEATRWLDGNIGWKDNRVIWRVTRSGQKDQEVFIESAQLEESERLLALWLHRKSRDLPESAYLTLKRRQATLQWAKAVATLQAPDLEVLAAASRRRNPAAHQALARLLVVEALSTDTLSPSPSRALAVAYPESEGQLRTVLNETLWPRPAQALAALTLGRAAADVRGEWKPFAELGARLVGSNLPLLGTPANCDLEIGFAFIARIAALDLAAAQHIVELMAQGAPWKPSWGQLRTLSTGLSPQEIGERLSRLLQWPEIWPEFPVMAAPVQGRSSMYARAVCRWKEVRLEARAKMLWLLWSMETQADQWRAIVFMRRFTEFPVRCLDPAILGREPEIHDLYLAAMMARDCFKAGFQLTYQAAKGQEFAGTLELLGEFLHPNMSPRRTAPDKSDNPRPKGKKKHRLQQAGSLQAAAIAAQPLLTLCQISGVEVARRLYRKGFWHILGREKWHNREWLELGEKFLDSTSDYSQVSAVAKQLQRFESLDVAQRSLHALIEAISQFPKPCRNTVWSDLIGYGCQNKFDYQQWWQNSIPLVNQLANWPIRYKNKIRGLTIAIRYMVRIAMVHSVPQEALQQCYEVLFKVTGRKRWSERAVSVIDDVVALAMHLSVGDAVLFERLIIALWPMLEKDYELWSGAREGAQLLRRFPSLQLPFVTFLERAPQRAMERLGELHTLIDCEATAPLATVSQTPQPSLPQNWEAILQTAPVTEGLAQQWAFWRLVSGLEIAPPKSAVKIAEWPRSFRRELAELEARPPQPSLVLRIENLKERLSDETALQTTMAREIEEVLRDNLGKAQIEAIEHLWRRAFRGRIRFLCGEFPAELENDENWRNAMLLACGVYDNRRWAQKLLRGELARQRGEPSDWRLQVVANARFLQTLATRGINTQTFLSRFEVRRCEWTLHRETDPLQILQMGNRFNTCLSRGGLNEHSSIANAIDLDKCVVYARDGKGNYIGRQLWAIADNGHLVGFTVYSTLPEKNREQRLALKRAFTAHAREFAAQCGLELADKGEVEPLAVPSWYDDGVCSWEGDCYGDTIETSSRGGKAKASVNSAGPTHQSQRTKKIAE